MIPLIPAAFRAICHLSTLHGSQDDPHSTARYSRLQRHPLRVLSEMQQLAQASPSDITWELVQEARMLREVATRRESTAGLGMTPCRSVTHGAGDRGNAGAGPTSEASPYRLDNFWAGVQRLKDLGWDLQAIEHQATGSWCVFQRRPSQLVGS